MMAFSWKCGSKAAAFVAVARDSQKAAAAPPHSKVRLRRTKMDQAIRIIRATASRALRFPQKHFARSALECGSEAAAFVMSRAIHRKRRLRRRTPKCACGARKWIKRFGLTAQLLPASSLGLRAALRAALVSVHRCADPAECRP